MAAAVDSFGNAMDTETDKHKKFNGTKHKNKKRKEQSPTIIAGDSISNGNIATSSQKYMGTLNEDGKIVLGNIYDQNMSNYACAKSLGNRSNQKTNNTKSANKVGMRVYSENKEDVLSTIYPSLRQKKAKNYPTIRGKFPVQGMNYEDYK